MEMLDPRELTFSQAQGYQALPGPLKLEQLLPAARTHIWNVVYFSMTQHGRDHDNSRYVSGPWQKILMTKHLWHDNRPVDDWNSSFAHHQQAMRTSIENLSFNHVFDLIQFILRHPDCPADTISAMKDIFATTRLAYTIDETKPPTIVPAVTDAEGQAIVKSIQALSHVGLDGSAAHLRKASEYINRSDWAGSIRESISAVESAARQLDPKASGALGPALASLESRQSLHPALKGAFTKLYAYTSDEQGIRHALLDQSSANVGLDETVFMLGACASFASFLWRKHASPELP